jgi:hypothetical protein
LLRKQLLHSCGKKIEILAVRYYGVALSVILRIASVGGVCAVLDLSGLCPNWIGCSYAASLWKVAQSKLRYFIMFYEHSCECT